MSRTFMAIASVALLAVCDGDGSLAADGKAVYFAHCAGCHEEGVNGAPAIGDVPAWAARAPAWTAVLDQHAREGYLAMPARGGEPGPDDLQVSAAVDYMVSRIAPPSILSEGAAEGRLVYRAACSRCHDTGVDGAPVIGDSDAWAARSLNWHTVLEQHADEGFLSMPARGDALQLFREDVAAAVAYMAAWARRR